MITLIEFDGAPDYTGVPTTYRYSTASDFMTAPGETPASTPYPPRVLTAGNFERHAWARGQTRGRSVVGYGVIVLDNSDGELDALRTVAVDGRPVVIRRGPGGNGEAYGSYPDDYPAYFAGTAQRLEFTWNEVHILIRDRQAVVYDLPYQTTKYGGTNSLPNGVDGVASDLKGKPKPKLRGAPSNFAPPCVNTSQLIYQLDDGTALLPMTISAVYVGGVALSVGTSRASLSALTGGTPTAGTYDYYAGSDGWFIKLGSDPAGKQVTVTASEGAATDRTTAQIAYRILAGTGVVAAADILGVSAMDVFNGAEICFWQGTEETTVGAVLDEVLDGLNGYWVDTRAGKFQIGWLADPTGDPVTTIEAWMIKGGANGVAILANSDPGEGISVWRVIPSYDRNYTVQSAADVAGAALSRLGYLIQEYREVSGIEDATIKVKHLLAPEYRIRTHFRTEAAATAEGQRQLLMRKGEIQYIEIPVDPEYAAAIDIGSTFKLVADRFDWSDGKLLWCLGLIEDYGSISAPTMTTIIARG